MIRKLIRATLEHTPTAAQFLRNSRDLLDRSASSKITPWGFTFSGHDSMAAGAFEPEETLLVRQLLDEVDVLVNVGANVGYYCCHALSLGKPVIAVEPIARNLHYLLTNIKNNGWSQQTEVYPVALGGGADILQMWGGGTGASLIKGWASTPESYVTQVPVLTLDRLMGKPLHGKKALILVDIEGAEYMMLQGAAQTLLNEPRPIWMMEISTTEHQPAGTTMNPKFAATFAVFFNRGYRAFTADEAQQELTKEDVAEVVASGRQLNTHNFIFR
jgi:FkbM family methyltransferase